MNRSSRIVLFVAIIGVCVAFGLTQAVYSQNAATDAQGTYLTRELEMERDNSAPLADLRLPNVFQVMVRFFFSLLIIVGLIWGAALLYNKFFGTKYYFGKDTDIIKILAHRYLDPKKSLYVIEVAQRVFVIGASAEQLQVLAEITDAESIQRMYNILEAKSEELKTKDFKKILAGFTAPAKTDEKTTGPETAEMRIPLVTNLRDHLQKLKRLINEK